MRFAPLLLLLLLGCSSGPFEVSELDSATPSFTPRAGIMGWVEGLPDQPHAKQMFGCDLGTPCLIPGGLTFSVQDHGDSMAILTFGPSVFCGKVTMPVEHTSQSNFVQIGLHWNYDLGVYYASDTLSASAPAAAECWAGSSMIFQVHYEVVKEALSPL